MAGVEPPGDDADHIRGAYTNHLISADGKNKITHLLELYGGTDKALETLLKEDADNAKTHLSHIYWYHGTISREEAEAVLRDGGNTNGTYLVRDSQSIPGNYALSLVSKGTAYHYPITECGEVYFNIDGGTIFQGIENLINCHKDSSHGLPSKLKQFIPKDPPPPSACRYGWTNFLHKAVIEGNSAIVRKILSSPLCPDINAKSSDTYHGSAALHDAAFLGHNDIILQLIDKGADIHLRDSNSMTPLHKACEGNQPDSVRILIEKGKADPHERSLITGSVPMHIAAMYGHTPCLEVLLSLDAPCWPRNEDDSTPYQLAERCGHKEAAKLLNEYRAPQPNVYMVDWYHRNLNREAAAELFNQVDAKDGTFLVRDSSKHPHWHVLAIMCEGVVFNFEIKNYENHIFYFIDDGPYLESIEHVIEHYSKRADGLPVKLEMAITPAVQLLDIKHVRPKRAGGVKEGKKKKKGKVPPPLVLTNLKSPSHIPPPTPDPLVSPNGRRPSLPITPTHNLQRKISEEKRPSLPLSLLLSSPRTAENFIYTPTTIERPPFTFAGDVNRPISPLSPVTDRPRQPLPNTEGLVNLFERGLRNLPTARDLSPGKSMGHRSPLTPPLKSPMSNSPLSASPKSNSPRFRSPSNSPLPGSPKVRTPSNPADRPPMPLPIHATHNTRNIPQYKSQQSLPADMRSPPLLPKHLGTAEIQIQGLPRYHTQVSCGSAASVSPPHYRTQHSSPGQKVKGFPLVVSSQTQQSPLASCTDLPAPPIVQPPVPPCTKDNRPALPPQKPTHSVSDETLSNEPKYPPPPPPSAQDLKVIMSTPSPTKVKAKKGIFKWSKKGKDKDKDKDLVSPESEYAEPTSPGDFLMIPYSHITLENEIGQGEFGSVYRGLWKRSSGKKINIAVKTLHPEIMFTASSKESFLSEARVMARLDHPCIVKLLGVSEGKLLLMIQELVAMGSLLNYLIEYPEKIHKQDLYLWAAQMACGMMYLEEKKFVHRDLAARNILLSTDKQIKISDFGLSRAVGTGSDYYQASKGGRWPVKWYAPECVLYGTFSTASDVWTFGVTLWEMFSYGAQPYEEVAAKDVIELLDKGERLPQPDQCPDRDYVTMNKCWQYKAQDRPTFDELNTEFADDPDYASINDLVLGRKW